MSTPNFVRKKSTHTKRGHLKTHVTQPNRGYFPKVVSGTRPPNSIGPRAEPHTLGAPPRPKDVSGAWPPTKLPRPSPRPEG
ncbi:hypothetical protein DEO72_LG3g1746 [Vigna unguiculata]|uniref:Uncharacterized protein n=1 Tax=Vigna unguiculata TaxID=3917 RepID=A0A4D6LF34_VIGUN|nr:hypothetical protein DEO72_LG3g1746 [Vigna unguiculata]